MWFSIISFFMVIVYIIYEIHIAYIILKDILKDKFMNILLPSNSFLLVLPIRKYNKIFCLNSTHAEYQHYTIVKITTLIVTSEPIRS